jgi:hypothetical protein
MYYCRIIVITVLFFGLWGCEKKIDFDLKEASPVLTVDASIESGTFPLVVLSRSLSYFSKVDIRAISESMVRDARVRIKADGKIIELLKQEIFIPGDLSFVYYTCDSLNAEQQIKGDQGKSYTLEIIWNNQLYTATTTIPPLRKTIDSLWWEKAPLTEDTSTKIILKGRFNDPPQFGDYIRYFTKTNREPFYPGSNSAFDDLLVNGTIYDIQIPRSIDRNAPLNFDDEPFFRRGDTITVKLSNIDKATYDFWRTTEFSYQSSGNPFFTPVKIIGNISNGALGYFGGYSNQFRTIIIPPL